MRRWVGVTLAPCPLRRNVLETTRIVLSPSHVPQALADIHALQCRGDQDSQEAAAALRLAGERGVKSCLLLFLRWHQMRAGSVNPPSHLLLAPGALRPASTSYACVRRV